MKLDELNVYILGIEIGERIWKIVLTWNYFEKNSIGIQLVRAVDSISANIAEGYGRYSYKENRQFCYYSRGSIFETKSWIDKAFQRKLIKESDYKEIIDILRDLGIKLNNYIKSIGYNNRMTIE